MSSSPTDLALPNAGPGPDPFTIGDDPADARVVVLLFQRDHYCRNCRNQVRRIGDRYEEFTDQDAAVVSIIPESVNRAQDWVERYDLPYPVLADPDHRAAESFDQPVRFGALGELHDVIGRMPLTVLQGRTKEGRSRIQTVSGRTPGDRPDVDALLAMIDNLDTSIPS